MKKRNPLADYRIYLSLIFALAVNIVFFPKEGKFKYDYHVGSPWMYETLISPIDFPILKTQQELNAEMAQKATMVLPFYYMNNGVAGSQVNQLKDIQCTSSEEDNMLHYVIEQLYNMYGVGILPDMDNAAEGTVMVDRDKRVVETPIQELYTQSKATEYLRYHTTAAYPDINVDSLFTAYRINSYVVPNLVYDQSKTELLHREAIDYISPTKGMVYAGQFIVSQGEMVTVEIEQLLNSFKREYEITYGYAESDYGLIAGHFVICFIVLACLLAVVYFTYREILEKRKPFYYIVTLYVLMFLVAIAIRKYDQGSMYLVPCSVFAIYMVIFYKRRYVFPIYAIMLLPLLFLSEKGVELYCMNLVGGIIGIISFRYFHRGWTQFLNTLFIFIGMSLAYIGFLLSGDGTLSMFNIGDMYRIGFNSILVVVAYPFAFIFERLFSLVSHFRLVELSDTNNKLLRELSQKAPGTFQHSLMVSNMATEAARSIGADMILARVGGLYHDIGKIANPQCFVENAAVGVNYHKDLSPLESAQQIIRHVDDGVDIARKNKLPEIVIDFIRTHHAQTLTFYFYAQYCNAGGDPENKAPFMYHGKLPTTKEQVIVLMADAVEAASRSLKDYTAESISELVENIIGKRLSDSQLTEADISVKEIELVKQMFKEHLEQVYHGRIAYPKIKNQEAQS